MEREQAQREIRNALNVSDELGRHAHARHTGELPYVLAALRTTLDELDRQVGGAGVQKPHVSELHRLGRELGAHRGELGTDLERRFGALLRSVKRVEDALEHPGDAVPSKTVLGVVPLVRALPHEAHAALDVVTALAAGAGLFVGRGTAAKVASVALATSALAVAATTDTRASFARVVQVEAHARFDVAWGLAAIAAPFALGYARSLAGALQIAAGATLIVASFVTDYRATRGLVSAERSRGGPATPVAEGLT